MTVAGVVAEYNPFHNGHLYHIEKTRQAGASHVVAVMSGNFVQRGDPAICSKWERARMALACGADLVLFLPVTACLSSAEQFARSAVYILGSLGIVDMLSFGSEIGEVSPLIEASDYISRDEFKQSLKAQLDKGFSYPAAFSNALSAFGNSYREIARPNNILAIEYINAINYYSFQIKPFTIKRRIAGHDSDIAEDNISSASFIRRNIKNNRFDTVKKFMPDKAYQILKQEIETGKTAVLDNVLERVILSKLRSMRREEFSDLPYISEGLENRIYNSVMNSTSLEELYRAIKSKRYPLSRIRRIIFSAFIGLKKSDVVHNEPGYVRVAGFNERGLELLNMIKRSSNVNIITEFSAVRNTENQHLFELEARASDLYSILLPVPSVCGSEYTSNIIKYLEYNF